MNDVNIQDVGPEKVQELLKENKRELKLVLRRAPKIVERNLKVTVPTNVYPIPGIKFVITALADPNAAVARGNYYHSLQDGDRIEMVYIN